MCNTRRSCGGLPVAPIRQALEQDTCWVTFRGWRRFYFTINERQSDIYVVELEGLK